MLSDRFSFNRIEEMLNVVKRSLDYMMLLETETDLASPVAEALLELIQLMDSATEKEKILQHGRPHIVIENSCPFWWRMVSALVTLQASFCVVVALLNEEWLNSQ